MPPASSPSSRPFRIERPEDLPPRERGAVDVAVLDMNHGWPNLGHDSLVRALLEDAASLPQPIAEAGVHLRVLSFDVRRCGAIPEPPGGRFALYIGTGGPGHIDPRLNDGTSPGSQGLDEDPSWEEPLFRLFEDILEHAEAGLLAICHSFGVLCRWARVAEPVLRGPAKGGKSAGLLENELTTQALEHPWFGRFGGAPAHRLRVLDSRLFDLIPRRRSFPAPLLPIGYETLGVGGPRGDALTMMEFARDHGGVMPRVFGVNHHPAVRDRARQLRILAAKVAAGEVSAEWAAERRETLTRSYSGEDSESRLEETAQATLIGPMRFLIRRQVRASAAELGVVPGDADPWDLDGVSQPRS